MGRHYGFTPDEDVAIRHMRETRRMTWEAIARALDRSLAGITGRARKLGLTVGTRRTPRRVDAVSSAPSAPEKPTRSPRELAGTDPLPPFHPIACGVLGCSADGMPMRH